jgi:hypothetical protein
MSVDELLLLGTGVVLVHILAFWYLGQVALLLILNSASLLLP